MVASMAKNERLTMKPGTGMNEEVSKAEVDARRAAVSSQESMERGKSHSLFLMTLSYAHPTASPKMR